MAVNIATSAGDEKEILEVFEAKGITPEVSNVQDGTEKSTEEEKTTDDATVEGDKHSETDPGKGDKSKTEEDDSQEQKEKPKEETKSKSDDDETVDSGKDKGKSKGGFQDKIAKKTRQIEILQDRLEEEQGGKAKLQAEIDQLRGEIKALKPAEEKKETVSERPKRPKKTDFDFDDAAYEAALDKYDTDLEVYNADLRKKELAALETSLEDKAKQEKQQERVRKVHEDFSKRYQEDAKGLDDLDELLEAIPKGHKTLMDLSPRAERYMMLNSKAPGLLAHYLANDTVNNDDAETERLAALDDDELVIELRTIESRLIAKRDAAAKKAAGTDGEEDTEESKKASADPVKPKPEQKKAPAAPLETVGGRGTGAGVTDWNARLAKAAEDGTYVQVRKQQIAAQAAARKRA